MPIHAVFATGWNDYDTELCGGYRLVRNNADDINIFKDGPGFVIPPKVAALNVQARIIFGRVERSPDADLASVPGFFILNTETDSVQTGLDEQTWLTSLRALGVSKDPALKRPSRFFMLKLHIERSVASIAVLCILFTVVVASFRWHKRHRQRRSAGAGCLWQLLYP